MAAEADYDALRMELDQLRSDIAGLTRTLKDIGAGETGAAYEKVKQSAHKAQEQAAQTVGAVGHEIGERPFTSVITAFSVGLMLGMMFSRRS